MPSETENESHPKFSNSNDRTLSEWIRQFYEEGHIVKVSDPQSGTTVETARIRRIRLIGFAALAVETSFSETWLRNLMNENVPKNMPYEDLERVVVAVTKLAKVRGIEVDSGWKYALTIRLLAFKAENDNFPRDYWPSF